MSDWQIPTELPDLRRVDVIGIDTEIKDDRLRAEMGSGWPFGAGHICGLSVAYRTDGAVHGLYFPIRHPDTQNFDPAQVYRWVRDHIAATPRFVTQNGLYDWGWLRKEAGIKMPPGDRLEEIGALATMVDENRFKYSLAALCAWRGLPGKDDTLLRQGIAELGLVENKRKKLVPQTYIWQLPARYVGPYAEADAINTFLLREDLCPILDREGTRAAYRLECDLLPLVLEMRLRGIRVDIAAAERDRDLLSSKRDAVFAELSEKLECKVGMHEIGSTKWLAESFDRLNIKYPRTEKGNPSFAGGQTGWMNKHPHPVPQLITKADKYNNAATKFLQNYILDHAVNGRIHAEIHPHRSEDRGTKSFRFSYSDPPLQQMTSRDEELAPLIRGVFLPEEGEFWAKPDASQQEFRLVVHYAHQHKLRKAADAVARYRDDPDADFHALAATLTGLERAAAKAVNFAKIYGAGVRKFADMIGKSQTEAERLYEQYDRELPFLRALSQIYTRQARTQGYIRLYDGARRHFDKFAPGGKWEKGAGPCGLEEARERIRDPKHPWYRRPLYRADTRNALNALIQGSAARHTKLWMRACWREGIVPLLQMHDCLDCSVSSREQAELVARLGCEAVQLDVPMGVDVKFGHTWGDAKHSWEELRGEDAPAVKASISTAPVKTTAPEPITPPSTINGAHVAMEVVPPAIVMPEPDSELRVHLADLVRETPYRGKVRCPFHDDNTPSCHIYPDHFHCFVCGAHGDALDWLTMVEGMDYGEAVEATENCKPRAVTRENEAENSGRALELWAEALPIADTPAAQYLAARHINIEALPASINEVLRFHPACPYEGVRHPCLIALHRDVASDAPAGIHRTALDRNGKKIGRLSLGRWPTPRAIKLWPAENVLVVAEGIETALAAATRINHRGALLRPAWACGSAGDLRKLPAITGVERLTILVDNDPTGRDSAEVCAQRWTASGRTVVLLTPRQPNADFNDIARERAS
jgi:DNA polymerase I-like protein with 3'-5' exonuclease and polymerase domains